MTRYADDLKKIVGIDKLIKRLEEQIEKDRINAKRGIGYGLVDGTVAGARAAAGTGTAPSNALGSNESGDTKALTDAALEALAGQLGGGSGGSDSGSGTSDSTGGGEGGTAGTNSDQGATYGGSDGVYDAALLMAGGGPRVGDGRRLIGITGIRDITTSRAVDIFNDGYYRGSEDRLTPDEDGVEPGFVLGYRWVGATGFFPTAGQAIDDFWQVNFRGGDEAPPGSGNKYEFLRSGQPYFVSGSWGCNYYIRQIASAGSLLIPPGSEIELNVGATACTVGIDFACLSAAPTRYEWLRGKAVQLGKNTLGQFIANPRDVDVPTLYKAASNILTFKYNNTQYMTQKPTYEGGFTIGESDSTGTYTGAVHAYNSAGQKVGVYANTYADQLLP